MLDEIMCGFGGSPQGRAALDALSVRGMTARNARRVVAAAVLATARAMAARVHGSHAPRRRLRELFGGADGAALAIRISDAIVRRDGVIGALDEAGLRIIAEQIGDALAHEQGLGGAVARDAAAVITPFIVRYAHEKLAAAPPVPRTRRQLQT